MDQTIKLHTANGNIPLTEEQKLQIIEDASKAYEKYLDALRMIGVTTLIVIIHQHVLQRLLLMIWQQVVITTHLK